MAKQQPENMLAKQQQRTMVTKQQQETIKKKPQQRSRRKITASKRCRLPELPREVRDMIYRHLLLDAKDGIQPQYHGLLRADDSQRLHINIMRTCWEVYREASAGM